MTYSYTGAHGFVQAHDSGTATSTYDSTGADLIGVSTATWGQTVTFTDSKGNTFTAETESGSGGNFRSQISYCQAPTVGTGHYQSGSVIGFCIFAACFSGSVSSPADQQNQHQTTSSATCTTGSITPSADNCLILASVGGGDAGFSQTISIDSGFTITDDAGQGQYFAGQAGGGLAYLIQTSASAVNPTWTSGGTADGIAAAIGSFKTSGGGGGDSLFGQMCM